MPRTSSVVTHRSVRTILLAVFIGVAGGGPLIAAPPKMTKKGKTPAATTAATEVKLVRVPDRGIQPQAAVDTTGTLHLIYLGDDPVAANVYYVSKSAGSERFSKHLHVNSQPGSRDCERFDPRGAIGAGEREPRPRRLERVGNGRAQGAGEIREPHALLAPQ